MWDLNADSATITQKFVDEQNIFCVGCLLSNLHGVSAFESLVSFDKMQCEILLHYLNRVGDSGLQGAQTTSDELLPCRRCRGGRFHRCRRIVSVVVHFGGGRRRGLWGGDLLDVGVRLPAFFTEGLVEGAAQLWEDKHGS